MRCLVTGGAGFIGSHLVDVLVRNGNVVRVLDNLTTGRLSNLEAVRDEVELLETDVRSPRALCDAVRKVEVVFHLAALNSVSRSLADPALAHDTNATGTLNVLLAAREAGVARVVYASSAAVYGDLSRYAQATEDTPAHPQSPYAIAKLTGELYCRSFSRLYGLPTVSLRYSNVFGPRLDATAPEASVVCSFVDRIRTGQPVFVYGDGEQTRDFVDVGSATAATLAAATATGIDGEVINVAGGQPLSIRKLAHLIGESCGRRAIIEFHSPRPGDILHSCCDISKARLLLGFDPAPLVTTLARLLAPP